MISQNFTICFSIVKFSDNKILFTKAFSYFPILLKINGQVYNLTIRIFKLFKVFNPQLIKIFYIMSNKINEIVKNKSILNKVFITPPKKPKKYINL